MSGIERGLRFEAGRQGGRDEVVLWGGRPHVRNRDPRRPLRHVTSGVERPRRRSTWLRSPKRGGLASTAHRFANMRPSGPRKGEAYRRNCPVPILCFVRSRIDLPHTIPLLSPVRQFRVHLGCFRSNGRASFSGRIVDNRKAHRQASSFGSLTSLRLISAFLATTSP